MIWDQYTLTLQPRPSGLHLITRDIAQAVTRLGEVQIGLLHVFLQHTSASLTINENADPDVRIDLEASLNHIAPEEFPYTHTIEGPDDMPAHVKSSILGCSLTVPVRQGQLGLGTWQGIFLCEHRNRATGRRLILTLHGQG